MFVLMILSSVKVPDLSPPGKELLARFNARLYIISFCNFDYFPAWLCGQDVPVLVISQALTFCYSLLGDATSQQPH